MNRLTAEMFEEIVATLRSDRSLRSNEKRNKPRVGLRSSLKIVPCRTSAEPSVPALVSVRDVSADGLGLISPRSFQIGIDFIADFERWERGLLQVRYKVAYCKMISRGLYSIGARLVGVVPAAGTKVKKTTTAA